MRDMTGPRMRSLLLAGVVLAGSASPAHADLNMFAYVASPAPRPAFGWSFGRASEAVGFEVEYAGYQASRDSRPTLGTIGASAVIQMPTRDNGLRWYGTVGFGMYAASWPNGGGSSGGTRNGGVGVKLPLAGRLKIRVDYRYFRFHADADADVTARRYTGSHRLSAGLTLTY